MRWGVCWMFSMGWVSGGGRWVMNFGIFVVVNYIIFVIICM